MTVFPRYAELITILAPPSRVLILIVLLMLAENGLALCSPWIAGQLTSNILSESSTLSLSYKQIILLWFGLVVFQAGLGYLSRILSGSTSEQMLVRLRTRLYAHLQSLPLLYHHDKKHGETLALITNDCSVVSSFVTGTIISLLPQLLTAAGAVTCIVWLNPVIACLLVLLIPLFYISIKLLGRQIRPISRQLMQQYASTLSLAEENLATLSAIKIFTRESHEELRFNTSNEALFGLSLQYLKSQARLSPAIKLLATLIVLTILWVSGDDIAAGRLATGDIVSLMLYGMLLTQPVSRLADTYGQIQRTAGASDRLLEVFSYPAEAADFGSTLPPIRGEIIFNAVTFSYPGRENVLDNLSLKVSPGETIAITGENGGGKSTLVHLLMRFCPTGSGSILIDGHNIEDVSLYSLRSQIGLVEQNVVLQNATVAENISFGKPQASYEEIVGAARSAHALDFIRALPAGFDTIIGDQGIKLSGGQKQRLSLARALLTDPAILILDEATAMFDPDGEMSFIHENKELLATRTVIIITHRPASLELADRIFRLQDGRLIDQSRTYLAQNRIFSYISM